MENKMTKEERRLEREKLFKQKMRDKFNGEWEVTGEYINSHSHIKLKHVTCGYEKSLSIKYLYSISNKTPNCPKCNPISHTNGRCSYNCEKPSEIYNNEIILYSNNKYSLISEYKGSTSAITIRNHETGFHKIIKRPGNFLYRLKARYGNDSYIPNPRKTTEDYKEQLNQICGERYTVLGEYSGYYVPITIHDNIMNVDINVNAGPFLSNKIYNAKQLLNKKKPVLLNKIHQAVKRA